MGHPAERSHRHNDCFGCGDGSASRCAWSRHASRNAGSPLPLLHQEPPTLLLIKLELDRSGCFGRHRRPRPSRALPRFCEMSTTRQRRPLLAGVLILLMPRLLNYIVAIYLIVVGLVGLNGIYHFMR
jgi:hypothetical protein